MKVNERSQRWKKKEKEGIWEKKKGRSAYERGLELVTMGRKTREELGTYHIEGTIQCVQHFTENVRVDLGLPYLYYMSLFLDHSHLDHGGHPVDLNWVNHILA